MNKIITTTFISVVSLVFANYVYSNENESKTLYPKEHAAHEKSLSYLKMAKECDFSKTIQFGMFGNIVAIPNEYSILPFVLNKDDRAPNLHNSIILESSRNNAYPSIIVIGKYESSLPHELTNFDTKIYSSEKQFKYKGFNIILRETYDAESIHNVLVYLNNEFISMLTPNKDLWSEIIDTHISLRDDHCVNSVKLDK